MFCTKCGNQIKDGFKFCPKCGTPVYVEKEKSRSEVKARVEEVKDGTSNNETGPKQDVKINDAAKSKAISSSHKTSTTLSINQDYIPNPLIEKELDIEGVKKKAEQGEKDAMLRQAFRYQMGIGIEKNIAKAEELYEKAGGKQALYLLERGHINSILPDPLYDRAFWPTFDINDDKNNVLRLIPFVKDVVLDYSNKVEQDKSQGQLSKEKSFNYRKEFILRMKEIREGHPELLLANMDETLTENDFNKILNNIKESVSTHYSLKWIPSLFHFSDSIDGNIIYIPSLYEIKSNGLFILNYHNEKDKECLLNQFILTLLLQLKIKKIRLNFVDLQKTYEYSNLLKLLNPVIYGDKPITSTDQLSDLLKHLEERKLEVIQKYGSYPEYCEQNQIIPLPYEMVILFDNIIIPQYEEAILDIMQDSYRFGVLFIIFTKTDKIIISNIGNGNIINLNKNELYIKNKPNGSYILENGVIPYIAHSKDVKLYALQFSMKSRSYLKNGLSLKDAEDLKKELESEGEKCEIIRFASNDCLNELWSYKKILTLKAMGHMKWLSSLSGIRTLIIIILE